MDNLIKSSWAINCVRCLYETDVLRTILVPIIRDLTSLNLVATKAPDHIRMDKIKN